MMRTSQKRIGGVIMPDDPVVPAALIADGLNMATYYAVIVVTSVLIGKVPEIKDNICQGLLARFDAHQKVVDEHGSAVNVNAAAALRLMMMQIGCNNIPDHR
jgi:hypothetical protein